MPGKGNKKRWKAYNKRIRRYERGHPEEGWDWSDDEGLDEAMGFDRKSMQEKHGISDEQWNFMQKNDDVEKALYGLANYNIKSVVDNWDKEWMLNIMGSYERAESVLTKLREWLGHYPQLADSVKVTSTINPYLVMFS